MITFNDLKPNQELAKELAPSFVNVLASGQYIGGEEVELFEKEFAAYVGAKHCVAVGNGFDALQIALKVTGIEKGKRVGIPSNTCLPTWMAAHNVGAEIFPIDPTDDYLIKAWHLPRGLDAVIPVHLYGNPVSKHEIDEMKQHHIVIEDACQAHGSWADGYHAGTMGDIGCFSFYPTKNLGCYGDGGTIVTDNDIYAENARKLRRYGKVGAINSCLDPLQAAFLRVKLKRLEEENERRNDMATFYRIKLADCDAVTLPPYDPTKFYNYHQFVIRVPKRDELQKWLKVCYIETMVHYRELPYKYFPTALNYNGSSRSLFLSEQVLSLPIANVTLDEITKISDSIKEFYAN